MFSSTILQIIITLIISIILISSLHYFWNYLKDTYSTKKTKDLVNTQIDKYKKIVDEIQKGSPSSSQKFLSEEEKKNMNNDLLQYANSISSSPTTEKETIIL
jgi:uncharacterized protein YpmB